SGNAILDAMRLLIEEREYRALTIEEISAAASVARSTFYAYFPSKLALFLRLCEEVVEELYDVAGQHYPDRSDFERIVLANAAYLRLWSNQRRVLSDLYALSLVEPEVARFYREARRRFQDRIAGRITYLLSKGRIPPADPIVLAGLLTGMVETFALRMNTEPPELEIGFQDAVLAVSEAWWRSVYGSPAPAYEVVIEDLPGLSEPSASDPEGV
ncbi:MAG: TetR/AcrR family transcriptional regulator, partial [Tepidiformaceae bacterium]